MAASMEVVVDELLCFTQNWRDSISSAILSKIVSGFYASDTIAELCTSFFSAVQSEGCFVRQHDAARPRGFLFMEDLLNEWHAVERAGVEIPTFVAKDLFRIPTIPDGAVNYASIVKDVANMQVYNQTVVDLKSDVAALRELLSPDSQGSLTHCMANLQEELSETKNKVNTSYPPDN